MTALFFDNIRIICPASNRDHDGCLLSEDGIIKAVGTKPELGTVPDHAQRIDGKGAVLIPGLVDMRVQSRNPGHAHQESMASLAAAAVAGGITSMVCLPNTDPVLDNPDGLAAAIRPASVGMPQLYAYGAASRGLEGTAMAELGLLAEAGAVGFSNGIETIADSLMMRRIMDYAAMLGKPVIQHAEDAVLAAHGEMNEGENSTRLGLRGIPAAAEEIIIARDITLARLTKVHYHVAHVSTRGGVNLIRRAKDEGLHVTCDTAPPYYMLNDLAPMEYDTRFQLSPPLRHEDDRMAILEAISDGTIDCIASDHAPHDRDGKLLPFGLAARGASGLETLLAMVVSLYKQGHLTLIDAIRMVTANPATLLDLPCGTLTVGGAADLTIFDPERSWKIRGNAFHSLAKSTPFEGQPAEGVVISTWISGKQAYLSEQGGRDK